MFLNKAHLNIFFLGHVLSRPRAVTMQVLPRQVLSRVENHSKVLIKAACKNNLKEVKMFTIRNVDLGPIQSITDLKTVIRDKLKEDIRKKFDVGYIQGKTVVRVCSEEDMAEMWSEIKKPGSTSLWCDGLIEATTKPKASRRRKLQLSDDSDDENLLFPQPKKRARVDNQEKVQEIVDILNNKHGSKYTPLQVRIWAELIASGLHPNSEQPPPSNSMFERAGTGGSSKPNQKDNSVVKVVADAASAITCALIKSI